MASGDCRGPRPVCLGQMARGGRATRKENSVADEPQAALAGEANGSFRLAGPPPAAPREHLLSRAPSARHKEGIIFPIHFICPVSACLLNADWGGNGGTDL